MSTKRIIEIRVETERVPLGLPMLCALIKLCADGAPNWPAMVTAAALSGVDSSTIYRRAAERAAHLFETFEGLLLICLNSLPKL